MQIFKWQNDQTIGIGPNQVEKRDSSKSSSFSSSSSSNTRSNHSHNMK